MNQCQINYVTHAPGPFRNVFCVVSLIFPVPKVKVKKMIKLQIEFVHSIYSVPNKIVQESDRKCTISDIKKHSPYLFLVKKNLPKN